jgi:hypothetical protein
VTRIISMRRIKESDIITYMPGESSNYNLPFPLSTDAVNVHGDIKSLVDRLNIILPPLGISAFQLPVINDSGSNLSAGDPVYISGYDSGSSKPTIEKAIATTPNPILGLLKQDLADGSEGIVVVAGVLENINTSSFATGDTLYIGISGGLTSTRPEGGSGAVGIVAHAASTGIIIVEAKGNGTWGALKNGLS